MTVEATTIKIPPPGSWCWGEQNVHYRVLSSHPTGVTIEYQDRPVLLHPDKVVGWVMPKFKEGDRVIAVGSFEPVGTMGRIFDCTPHVAFVKYDNGSEGFGDPDWWEPIGTTPVYWEGCMVVLNGNGNSKWYVKELPQDGMVVIRRGNEVKTVPVDSITPAVPQK